MKRISVSVNDAVVPLFSERPLRDSRFSPWKGLLVEKHSVGAIEVPEHVHSSFCLHMQVSGPVEMEWQSDGKQATTITRAGSMILLGPGTKDAVRWNRGSRRLIVSIDDELIRRASEELEFRQTPIFENRWGFEDDQLQLILGEIEREMEGNWSTGELYGDLLGMKLSSVLLRRYGHAGISPVALYGDLSKARLARVLEYMEEQSHANPRLADLAEVAGTSVFHFARMFREATGLPPHKYLLFKRIEKAKTLLRFSRQSALEIALATGFTNPSHFAKTFRQIVGVSPSDWKASVNH